MDKLRYNRQIRLAGFGLPAQQALFEARVLVVGAGGLGVPVLQYLNAMGVGQLCIMDGDSIEKSNLHRQPLYTPEDIGKQKVDILKTYLKRQNPETVIEVLDTFLHPKNALETIRDFDLVIDGTDNLATRYLIDDSCVIAGIPWIYGAMHAYEGQLSVFNYKDGPTYRCLYPNMPGPEEIPDCNAMGTLGVLPGIIGNLQALEAVKVICKIGTVLSGSLMIYNALNQEISQFRISKNTQSDRHELLEKGDYRLVGCMSEGGIGLSDFNDAWNKEEKPLLIDVREPEEFDNKHHPRAVNIPLSQLSEQLPLIRSHSGIFLICRSGPRSLEAYEYLKAADSDSEIYWIQGGMLQYQTENA